MANTQANVSVGKPAVTGAIWWAPAGTVTGTAIPSDATTALNSAFVCLGYVSEDGLTNTNSPETEEIKAWGGDVVLNPLTSKADTFKFKLIEALNVNVLKAVYGSDNVTGSLSDGLTVKANSKEIADTVWVYETILTGNTCKRIVLPSGQLTELGDIVYKDNEPVGYDVTVTAHPDSSGNTHYEYAKTVTSST